MSELDDLKRQYANGRLSRRDFMGRAAALGVGAALLSSMVPDLAMAADAPRKGGVLRLGMGGGSTTDSLDPRTYDESVALACGFALFNTLIENGPDNKPIPSLAESWEAKPGAAEWIFTLRKGVTFSNGKAFTADDAIYSLNLHRGASKSGASAQMKSVTDIKKLDDNKIQVTLASGDADFPYIFTDYHMHMVPDGFTDFSKPIGTGAFELVSFDPGVRIVFKRTREFWKTGRGHLDGLEITVINDSSARLNALISGQVDAINRLDPKAIATVKKSSKLEVVQAPGGWFPIISMFIDAEPYSNVDVRQALRYGLNREAVLKTMFAGYGTLGNDHPIPKGDPYHNPNLPQIAYDPDKAKFHFKKAGLSNPTILLSASDAAFGGAVDMATLFQANAAKADIKIDVRKEPADGFFTNVWLKKPFVTSYWGGRPSATQMLSVAFKSDAPWNETHWKRPDFDKLLSDAKSELDEAKRKDYIWTMQKMLHDEGAAIIPVFRDWLDAHSSKVGGLTPHSGFDMDNGLVAEKIWLKA
ncbi:MAG TPA: ABC transporter substrate-binding protein [Stellaceae bacterium]|nr:ABC transporter substrate-binding protein [Stellaceae bacterium]